MVTIEAWMGAVMVYIGLPALLTISGITAPLTYLEWRRQARKRAKVVRLRARVERIEAA